MKPLRTSAWSSATTTRIVIACARRSGSTCASTRKPPPGARTGGELAAPDARPARACRRRPWPGRRRRWPPPRPRPSSTTSTRSRAGLVANGHVDRGRPGVLDHVGQRLLHDPVGRQLDAGGHRPSPSPSTCSVDRHAGAPARRRRARSRSAEPGRRRGATARRRSSRSTPSSRRISVERPRLTSPRSPRAPRGPRAGWSSRTWAPTPACTAITRHRVGDDVVQLLGDAQPLLGDSAPRLAFRVAPLRSAAGALLERSRAAARRAMSPNAQSGGEHERRADDVRTVSSPGVAEPSTSERERRRRRARRCRRVGARHDARPCR